MISRNEAKTALRGPIPTIRTPFLPDGVIDYKSLKKMIDFNIHAGANTIVLTAGDSHLIAMSDSEISEVTKATTEHVNGRTMVVAADRWYDTKQAVSFAEYASEIGVDVLMLMPPDWAKSTTPELLADHYAEVAGRIPVMIVTNVFIPRGIDFGLKVIEHVLEKTENVVAIKDDMCGEFARKLALLTHEKLALWAGGLKQNHLNMAPYGCDGYLSTFLSFKPEISHGYWNAFVSGDIEAAVRIIEEVDMPFFDFISGFAGGFDAAIHGVLELYGLAQRWRPKPYHSMDDREMERLSEFMKSKDLL